MPVQIPQSLRTMLEDKAYGHVVTFNATGKPELTMVWIDIEVTSCYSIPPRDDGNRTTFAAIRV